MGGAARRPTGCTPTRWAMRSPGSSAALLRAFAISALGSITYYVGITYVPAFLDTTGTLGEERVLWLSTAAAVAVILVTPLVGLLSDRFGRKPALVVHRAAQRGAADLAVHADGRGERQAEALAGALVLALVAGGMSAVGAIACGEQFSEESRASGLGLAIPWRRRCSAG